MDTHRRIEQGEDVGRRIGINYEFQGAGIVRRAEIIDGTENWCPFLRRNGSIFEKKKRNNTTNELCVFLYIHQQQKLVRGAITPTAAQLYSTS